VELNLSWESKSRLSNTAMSRFPEPVRPLTCSQKLTNILQWKEDHGSTFRVSLELCSLHYSLWVLGLLFHPDDGGNILLRNDSKLLPDYSAPRRYSCSQWLLWSQISQIWLYSEWWVVKNSKLSLGVERGVRNWVHLVRRPLIGLLYQPRMMSVSSRLNENWQGKLKYSERTCPSATLSTTNSTWHDLGSNPGLRGRKPATNRLSCGTVNMVGYFTKLSSSKLHNIVQYVVGLKFSQWWLWSSP
jgi:hypothetical protein